MNYLDKCMRAMTGPDRGLVAAWNMATASYAYTASFIGNTDPSVGEPVFTHWDAFKGAWEIFWEYLFRSPSGDQQQEEKP